MSRQFLPAVFLSAVLVSSGAQEEKTPSPPKPPSTIAARPHRWPAPPIEMERPRLSTEGTGPLLGQPPPLKPLPAPTSPTPVTSCDRGGCWDATGNRYNGGSSTMIRSDGKACTQIGNMMHCN